MTVTCPYCDGKAVLRDSAMLYGGRSYGPAWVCENYPKCDAYVGCHPGTEEPLGRLADPQLRRNKKAAHAAFDPLWKAKQRKERCNKKTARNAAYAWLAEQLGLSIDECHIGMFDVAMCQRVVEVCAPYNKRRTA